MGTPAPRETPFKLPPDTPSTALPPFRPPKPQNGGLVQISHKEFVPWTGGIPNRTWTGLDPKASTTHRFANQLRHLGSYAGTNELNRRQGLAKKFEKGDCLTTLTHQLTQHLLTHGMDTMAYVPSPVDGSTEMVSIIDHHGLFDTPEALAVTLEPFRKKWDAYDEGNNSEATASSSHPSCLTFIPWCSP